MKVIKILVANILIAFGILFILEIFFYTINPLNSLPINGVIEDQHFTWGNKVELNSLGFREKEVKNPKPEGLYRVMVLGDSLTWGAGLSNKQRYTNLTDEFLRTKYKKNNIEVLNFGVSGGPMVLYHQVLKKLHSIIDPDLIVVGFCLNDPQTRSQNYSIEREKYSLILSNWFSFLDLLGKLLPNISMKLNNSTWVFLEKTNKVPTWYDALDRTYNNDSNEWQNFSHALEGILEISDSLSLDKPIFLVLNQGSSTVNKTSYISPDPLLEKFINWYELAENEAKSMGYYTVNHIEEFKEELDGKVLGINVLDGHPSPEENLIYARKLSKTIYENYLEKN